MTGARGGVIKWFWKAVKRNFWGLASWVIFIMFSTLEVRNMRKEKKLGILAAVMALALGGATVSQAAFVLDEAKGDGITIKVETKTESNKTTATVSAITGNVSTLNKGLVTGETIYTYLHDTALNLGSDNTVSGDIYSVYGYMNTVNQYATAIGTLNNYYSGEAGEMSQAVGFLNTSTGEGATAVGYANTATGDYATAIGAANEASAENAAAMGTNNEASAENSVAFGAHNIAGGDYSSAMGVSNKVYSVQSAAFGYNNIVGEVTEGEDGEIIITDGKGSNTYVLGGNNTVAANDALVVGIGVTGTIGDGAIVLGSDITGNVAEGSVVIGNGSTSEDADTVSVGSATLQRKIVHVADGTEKTDAATFGQIAKKDTYEVKDGKVEVKTNAGGTAFTITGIGTGADVGDTSKLADAGLGDNVVDSVLSVNDKVGSLSNDINKVGAGAAALAALHPEGFDPADKWSFAVGYGHYKNANAGALGAFYKPNFDTTLSIGGTIGNGSSMMNAGVSFKLGQRGARLSQNASNSQLVQEVNSLRAENASQAQQIASQAKEIQELKAQMAKVLAKVGG